MQTEISLDQDEVPASQNYAVELEPDMCFLWLVKMEWSGTSGDVQSPYHCTFLCGEFWSRVGISSREKLSV